MLQKEEKITLVLMVMALLVLIIAYFGFVAGEVAEYSSGSAIGDKVKLQGEVVGKRGTFTGDHLILTLDSKGSLVKVFIHRNNGAGQVNLSVDISDTVEIIGTVEEYEGEREIVVSRPADVKVVE